MAVHPQPGPGELSDLRSQSRAGTGTDHPVNREEGSDHPRGVQQRRSQRFPELGVLMRHWRQVGWRRDIVCLSCCRGWGRNEVAASKLWFATVRFLLTSWLYFTHLCLNTSLTLTCLPRNDHMFLPVSCNCFIHASLTNLCRAATSGKISLAVPGHRRSTC